MANELRGVEVRLERAYEHIHALAHEAKMFMMELPDPYGHAIPDKAVDGVCIVRAKIFRAPPARLGVLAADAAHNLRAALDMIAWELALKGLKPPGEDDPQTGFPICTHPDAWEGRVTQRMIERIPEYAVQMIKSFQPYDNGQPPYLGIVQGIDNWAKHHAIPDLLTFHISRFLVLSGQEVVSLNLGAFEDGDEICRIRTSNSLSADGREHFTTRMSCHVGFSAHGPAQGAPVEVLENAYLHIREVIFPAFEGFFTD